MKEDTILGHKGHWELDPSGKQDCIFVPDKPEPTTPPALFSAEQLEQIRVVVREELQAQRKAIVWNAETMTSEELTERLKDWKPVIEQRECDEAIEGHPSITAELEHQGKLYKGILYFVKDVE